MEALFKKQFWMVNLMFLAANAFLLARAGNQFVAYFVVRQATPVAKAAEMRRPPLPVSKHQIGQLDDSNNMFGATVEDLSKPVATAEATDEPKAAMNDEPVATSLRIKLAGVTWYDEPQWSLASITDLATQDTALYSINTCPAAAPAPVDPEEEAVDVRRRHPCNQLLADATITSIEPERVVFVNKTANRREFIGLHEDPAAAGPMVSSTTMPPPPTPTEAKGADVALGKGITKIAENQYKVPQSDVDEVVANLNTVATQARIVPSFEGGKANGFKLFSIRPNSVYSKIGIQNGDVINRINGYEITSPDKALEVYSKLQSSKEITVDVTRRGQKMTMSYTIQ